MPTKKTIAKKSAKKDIDQRWLIPIMLVGLCFRIYNNTAVALWHDEAFSALYVRDYGFSEMMRRIALDVHPPLYYWILRLWTYVFGTHIASLRGLSIIFGTATIWVGYLFIKKAFRSERLAMVAALFLAINPFQVQYSLEARMYTLGTFLILLSSYWLLKALENNKWRDWTIYGVLVAACFYTHYYLIFSCAAQGLYVIYWIIKNKKYSFKFADSTIWRSAYSYILTGLLFLPWLPTFLVQRARVDKQYWIPAMDRWSIPGTIWKMFFGGQGIPQIGHSDHPTLIIGALIAFIILVLVIRKIPRQEKYLVLLSLIVPFILSIVLSLQQAIYLDRYFVFSSLFFTFLIILALDLIPQPNVRTVIISVLVAITVFAFFKNWQDVDVKNLFINRSVNKKPGMAAAAQVVNEYARSGDHIYVGSSFVYFTFRYYNQSGIHPQLISDRPLEQIPHFSGTALLSPSDLVLEDTIFNHPEVSANDTVWLVWTTGFGGSKPNVPGSWSTVAEYSYGDTPGFKGDIYITEYHVNQ
jgi:mannosyltransferase